MKTPNVPKNLGMLLLGIWLIATGILQLHLISIESQIVFIILGLLAIATGVLIVLRR